MRAVLPGVGGQERFSMLPATDRRTQWRRDYDAMRESMFFGEAPDFGEIIAVVHAFEQRINIG